MFLRARGHKAWRAAILLQFDAAFPAGENGRGAEATRGRTLCFARCEYKPVYPKIVP